MLDVVHCRSELNNFDCSYQAEVLIRLPEKITDARTDVTCWEEEMT